MATAKEIIKQAFREGNLLALNVEVTPLQETEALTLLNRFLEGLYGMELGEFYMDWPTPPSTTSPVLSRFPLFPGSENLPSNVWPYPPGNVRVLLNLAADTTIYFPQAPDDGARIQFVNVGAAAAGSLTIDGNGRLVSGGATLVDTPGNLNQLRLLYRADLGDWVAITTLVLDDSSPLPEVYDDLLALGLHIRLGPRYGRGISKENSVTFSRLLKRLKTQYRQTTPVPSAAPQPFSTPLANTDSFRQGGGSLF